MGLVTEKKAVQTKANAVKKLDSPLITFFRAYPKALPAMCADRSALGTIPAQAYQYCEALTTASAFGWYAFPADDLRLWFDGVDVYRAYDDEWQRLSSDSLPNMDNWWNTQCPPHLRDMAPPFVTYLGIPGYIQIWSGLMIQSRKDWSVLVRPIANAPRSNMHFCFEGIVETDNFAPCPLFINLKLQATNTVIDISAIEPLFQVQPIHRDCYSRSNLAAFEQRELSPHSPSVPGMTDLDWLGYQKTIRNADPSVDMHSTGQYATSTRKRARSAD